MAQDLAAVRSASSSLSLGVPWLGSRAGRIAVAVLAMAASAQLKIYLPYSPVPVTLQTAAILLSAALLGARDGVTATLAYLGLGAASSLAAGAAVMALGAYTLLALWQYRQNCEFFESTRCYDVRDPLDLAMFAAAIAGATFGFLWWNTAPASIFMDDTGSLSLGGAIAALAILTRTELLLPLLAGLFLIVTLSVIGQVGSYKLTGRRMFRMAPLHHHFEMLGWAEIQIVVRFWIIQGLFVALGLGLFYAEWIRRPG